MDLNYLNASLSTSNPQPLGVTVSNLVGSSGTKVTLTGNSQDSSVLSQILNGIKYVYDNRNSSSSSIPVTLNQVVKLKKCLKLKIFKQNQG